jgi:uncharacterized radical SAM superfamily Fe-S cluster-containing enzyme
MKVFSFISMEGLEHTESLCPRCLTRVPAEITSDGSKVYMEKSCPVHGSFRALLWSDLTLYKRALRFSTSGRPAKPKIGETIKGCPYDCGLCPEHRQHTCLAIIEVTDSCNLMCPVCLADSRSEPAWMPSANEIEDMLKELLWFEGGPTALQLSGGEPTIRRDLPEIVAIARDLGFKLIEVDTNGVELAKRPELAKELADFGLRGVYLQFDGFTRDVHLALRGVDLTKIKEKALENCVKAGLSATLAVTVVKGVNDGQLWDLIRYAISRRAVGVNFQPFAALGRYPKPLFDPLNRTTISDVQLQLQRQSGGVLRALDFIPVPCPDPRCSALVYACYGAGEVKVINRLVEVELLVNKYGLKDDFIDFDELLKAVADEVGASREFARNLKCCPDRCLDAGVMGSSLRLLLEYLKPEGFFCVGCHFAQDSWTVDLKRLKKCCVHEVRSNGVLIPFCLYNMTSEDGGKLYRGRV